MKEQSVIFWFRNEQLKSILIKAIEDVGLSYRVTGDGIVLYQQRNSVKNFVDQIADTVFSDGWYRTEISDSAKAERYRRFTKSTGATIIEERYRDEVWFIQKMVEKLYRNKGIPTHVSFILMDNDLNPKTITKQLGISPTFACLKGEPFTRPYGKRRKDAPLRPGATGWWELCSLPHIESNDIDLHLEWLFKKLDPMASKLRNLAEESTNNEYCVLQIEIVEEEFNIYSISLSGNLLERLSILCDRVDIGFWPDDYLSAMNPS